MSESETAFTVQSICIQPGNCYHSADHGKDQHQLLRSAMQEGEIC